MATVTKSPTQVVTGKVRLSYFHGFEKHANEDGKALYSTAVLIPKSDKKTLESFAVAVEAAKAIGKDKKWSGKIPAKLKLPLRDGDDPEEPRSKDDAYNGHFFFNCSTDNPPGIVKKDPATGALMVITDKLEVCSGDYARVSVNLFPFAGKQNGVGVGLNNVQFLSKGAPLSGGTRAEDDFADDFEDDGADAGSGAADDSDMM